MQLFRVFTVFSVIPADCISISSDEMFDSFSDICAPDPLLASTATAFAFISADDATTAICGCKLPTPGSSINDVEDGTATLPF